jgi:hypothetical protein
MVYIYISTNEDEDRRTVLFEDEKIPPYYIYLIRKKEGWQGDSFCRKTEETGKR